jgi:hypothetical protein
MAARILKFPFGTPVNAGKVWSDMDDNDLIHFDEVSKPIAETAEFLCRTEDEVVKRRMRATTRATSSIVPAAASMSAREEWEIAETRAEDPVEVRTVERTAKYLQLRMNVAARGGDKSWHDTRNVRTPPWSPGCCSPSRSHLAHCRRRRRG